MLSCVKPNCSQRLASGSAPRGTHSGTFWLLPGDCNDEVVCGLEPRVFSGLSRWLSGKESAYQCKRHDVQSLGQEDPLEEEMATHFAIIAWEIPWTECGGLHTKGSQRVRYG